MGEIEMVRALQRLRARRLPAGALSVAIALCWLLPSGRPAQAASGLSLAVTEVAASKREGNAYYDPRLGKAISKLKKAGLAYNHFEFVSKSSRALRSAAPAVFVLSRGRKMTVRLLDTSPDRPKYASLDITVKKVLHTQTLLKPGSLLLFHLPAGAEPPRGTIWVLHLTGTVPPPPEPTRQEPNR